LPYPLESARAAYFHFRQWFTGVIISYDLLDPLHTVLEDLVLPPVVPLFLCQVSPVNEFLRFPYFLCEEACPFGVLQDQFL